MRQLELATAERERQNSEVALVALESEHDAELNTNLAPLMMDHRYRYAANASEKITRKREDLKAHTGTCNRAREQLLKARMERKKFETHKDAHVNQRRISEQRVNQSRQDEAAAQQFLRWQGERGNED